MVDAADDRLAPDYKVLMVGDVDVGKSSFIRRYVQNMFTPNYKATSDVPKDDVGCGACPVAAGATVNWHPVHAFPCRWRGLADGAVAWMDSGTYPFSRCLRHRAAQLCDIDRPTAAFLSLYAAPTPLLWAPAVWHSLCGIPVCHRPLALPTPPPSWSRPGPHACSSLTVRRRVWWYTPAPAPSSVCDLGD
eukprot:gene3231-3748_t